MQIYFRDKYIEESEAYIGLNDRSFRFGDGVFETAIISGAKTWDWPRHAKRLQNAILPAHKLVKEYLVDSFIFYKPKSFFWRRRKILSVGSMYVRDFLLPTFAVCFRLKDFSNLFFMLRLRIAILLL